MNVNRIPIVTSLLLSASMDAAWVCACFSRMLLLLIAVELITMPITQHLWTWDQFLHGGRDFEMTLLIVVTCFCFMLLRAQNSRQSLGRLLSIGSSLLHIHSDTRQCTGDDSAHRSTAGGPPLPANSLELRSLPLLI